MVIIIIIISTALPAKSQELAHDDMLTEESYELANKVQEEGTVLLKNNGILPLKVGNEIVPFGYGFLNPVYGQMTVSGSAKYDAEIYNGLAQKKDSTAGVVLTRSGQEGSDKKYGGYVNISNVNNWFRVEMIFPGPKVNL